MSCLHSMKKEISKNTLKFPPEMYNTMVGSLVICGYMFNEKKPEIKDIKKMWKKVRKNVELLPDFSEEDFIDKVLDLFGMCKPADFPIAFCQSTYNSLFAPFIDGQIYPVRDDGVYARTLKEGKIYPIEEMPNEPSTNNTPADTEEAEQQK